MKRFTFRCPYEVKEKSYRKFEIRDLRYKTLKGTYHGRVISCRPITGAYIEGIIYNIEIEILKFVKEKKDERKPPKGREVEQRDAA